MEPDTDELARLKTQEWWREKYTARDSIVYTPQGKQIKKGGRGHEHCRLCMDGISALDPTRRWGYRNEDDNWLCEACYGLYLKPESGSTA